MGSMATAVSIRGARGVGRQRGEEGVTSKELADLMRVVRAENPEAYQALLLLWRALVESSSTSS